ncbi:MAG: DUF5696 domain-containing protein [Verrucomicrobiota bacterium]
MTKRPAALRCLLIAIALAGLVIARTGYGQPAIVPDDALMNLDELGVYAVGYAYRGQSEQQFPLGWSGYFEDVTGVACEPAGSQNGKRAFLLHCPWRGGTGISFQQFNFSLPGAATRILLRGAVAMRSDIITQSDGATFRVYVNGQKQLDTNRTNDVWLNFEYDLTSLKGSNVLIRFETDPGPKNNASYDFSLWGQRELALEGYTPVTNSHPAPPTLTLANLYPVQNNEVAPAGGFTGKSSVYLSNDVVHFCYTGADGFLDYQWQRPSGTIGFLGTVTLQARMTGDVPVSVPLSGSASLTWSSTATAGTNGWVATNGTYALVRNYTVLGSNATVRITGRPIGKSLVFEVNCDQPRLSTLDAGMWGPVVRRRQMVTPYYSGSVYYLPNENLFVNAFLDWSSSSASSFNGVAASYGALTDGTRNRLSERIIYTAAWHLAEVFPNLPAPPSPQLSYLANKVVLDIWSGSFTNIANNLTNLADYGITNCIAIIHNWQRSGYDNALPQHYPANTNLGGDVGLSNLVATGAGLGIRCAIHENYVDYYPNYDFFTTNEIALNSTSGLIHAWFNTGTGIQSFAEKPNAILSLAATQSPVIHSRYGTKANFLDVHSSVEPWFHVDYRAGETGAGKFSRVWDVHRQLWAYERATHGGPVFGEGNHHWYWSGYLDGTEAQFGTGWPENDGFDAPLQVEFDLLKIHPLQFNHGMGYASRWWPGNYDTNWAGPAPMVVMDQYRLQEVAYGHAGFLNSDVYANVPVAWLEHHLVSPVTARYATNRPVDIQYESGGVWRDITAAVKTETGSTNNRVRVTYANGLVLTANSSTNALATGPWTLPQFGWVAEGTDIKAGTILRDGVMVDFADTGDTYFANARPGSDWNLSSFHRVRPSVTNFQQTAARAFRFTYAWDVQDRLPKDYRCFVHFVTNSTIRWQQDHPLALPTSQWQVGQVISDGPWTLTLATNIPDGDYGWLIGMTDTNDGSRVRLSGVDDGTTRIQLGILQVRTNGASLTFVPETNAPSYDPGTLYQQHLNVSNAVVDFGALRTDGSVLMRRDGNVWTLKTWPRDRNFTLELDAQRFEQPPNVLSIGTTNTQLVPVPAGSRWRLPLNGGREYRWTKFGAHPATMVPKGAQWRYWDYGTDPGAGWRSNAFTEVGWKTGYAELGFGDTSKGRPEATVVARTNALGGTNVSWYFRREFLVTDPSPVQSLTGRLLRDDGAAVYLNGAEVWRDNLPAGPLTYQTLATNTISGAAETNWLTNAISPLLLIPGTNLIAVEVHQVTITSSDMSFDFELTSQVLVKTQPQVGLRLVAGKSELNWPPDAGIFTLYATTNIFPVPFWQPVTNPPLFSNGQWNLELPFPANRSRYYRLQVQ